jgi:hypothetical protein
MGMFDDIKHQAEDLLAQASGSLSTAQESAGSQAAAALESAKSAVSSSSDTVAGLVGKAADKIDQSTGGRSAPLTGAARSVTEQATEAGKKLTGGSSSNA